MQFKSILALIVASLAFPAGLWAEDAHHTLPTEDATQETAPAPAEAMGMMAMMPEMMRMMQEMGDPTRHVEGRIAFLHAELGITEAQEQAWKSLADALRQNAAGLKQATPAEHGYDAESGVLGQLLQQQHMLEARLDGLRAVNAALKPLVDALSDEQHRALDALFPNVAGMMTMGGMMPMEGMMPTGSGMPGMVKPTP